MSSDKKASIFESIVNLDNKSITLEIGENSDGAFLRIVEKGRKTGLIIPVEGINDLKNALIDASKAAVSHGLITKPGSRGPKSAAAAPAAAGAAAPKAAREPREPRAAEADAPSNSVYVAGLTWDTTEEQLRNHFKKAGAIVTASILTRKRGKDVVSRGCGIVEFRTISDANRAIRDLEGTELDGRKISVRADRKAGGSDGAAASATAAAAAAAAPAEERKPRERKPRTPIAEENKKLEPTKVFVSNISWDTTPELLSNFAAAIGEVKHCDVLTTRTGRSLGHAVIEFTRASYATEAIQRLNGKELDGRIIGAKEFYAFVETK